MWRWCGPIRCPRGRIKGFLVERGAQGFSTPTIQAKARCGRSVTGEIVLDDVFVDEEALLPVPLA
ncbi:hypothetical protein [Salinicola tamaricis]|uniref:hypothetical protein n=1 Tax=Salinicola tamaricis TaxID=1771309 RepID=UPI002413D2CF|nr:hypothetical protein [Salinicola tamaricis]